MPTGTNNLKGRQLGHASVEPMGNQGLAEPQPDDLRNLVLNYLCHNCYLKTAEAFIKDSAVRHLDEDGNEIEDATTGRRAGDGGFGSQGSIDLNEDIIRNIRLRQRIQFEILSGRVDEAARLLNQHFPNVLAEDDACDDMEVSDENADPSRLEYAAETVNPIHLSLNLRILGFIEACRTVPLVYNPPSRSAGSPMAVDSDANLASPVKREPQDEDKHQAELLVRVQRLYATVNALRKSEDRAIYQKELSNVGGLLAYVVPENSPMVKYLHQERRDRVAEQINSAILHHTNTPTVSHLELAVRYTHCLWAALHELRAKIPANQLSGLLFPPGIGKQGAGDSSKELSQEASRFDLQSFLNART